MSYLIEAREIGDYRIKVFQDNDAGSPCQDWDMAGVFIWDNNEFGGRNRISQSCNWEMLFGKYDNADHTMCDALRKLIYKYVSQSSLLRYLKKGKLGSIKMEYNKLDNEWEETAYDSRDNYLWSCQFSPRDLEQDCLAELTENMSNDELVQIITDVAKDIAFKEWSSTGYSQGDYVKGFVYCDKRRFMQMVYSNTMNWKERALKAFDGEVKDIGMWMWGDVIGYVLEKKIYYKKVYVDGVRDPDDGYDWEQVDSCWGFYIETDELIDMILAIHGIKKDNAA